MPYNNTPIAPPKEPTGQVALPLARVKKIIHADDDITNCSNNAAFVITLATEMFVQYFVEQAFNAVKAEKKPRKNLQYKDVVSRVDNLEFLSDVVPKTVLFKKVKDGKAKGAQKAEKTSQPNGKTPVEAEETNGEAKPDEEREPSEPEEREESGDEMDVDDNDDKNYRSSVRLDGPVQMEMEIRGSRSSARLSGRGRPSINGAPSEDEGEEVESAG